MSRSSSPAVVMDFGGVVQELHDTTLCDLIAGELGVAPAVFRSYFDAAIPLVQTGALSEHEFLTEFGRLHSLALPENWQSLFILPFVSHSRLYPAVVALLERLRGAGVVLAVLSNTIPSHARLNRQRQNYRWFGQHVFLSCEMGIRKPARESFLHVLKQLDREGRDVIFVDDEEENVKEAAKAGLRAIQHDSEVTPADDLLNRLEAAGLSPQASYDES